MGEYITKYPFLLNADGLTMAEVQRIFQLDPEPPEVEDINDYIQSAVDTADLRHFTFFLHHYEKRLNNRVYRFLIREGIDRYNPERFLDYKLSCVLAMLEDLPKYDSSKGADFLTFAHFNIGNALLECRMREEAGSFENVDEYKAVRNIAWLYNNSGKSEKEVIAEYAAGQKCSEKTAAEHLGVARMNRSRVPFYATIQDEDEEETGEDVTRDDSWNYADILWNGIRTDAVQSAFEKLTYREQTLLEERNAICMTCGRVSPLSSRSSFEDLATKFEGSTAGGAERAYVKAVDKLTRKLVENGALHSVELRRVSQIKTGKKISAAVYEYRAMYGLWTCDGEWGKIQFDFSAGTAKIEALADWDTTVSHIFANRAISHLLSLPVDALPKKLLLTFE